MCIVGALSSLMRSTETTYIAVVHSRCMRCYLLSELLRSHDERLLATTLRKPANSTKTPLTKVPRQKYRSNTGNLWYRRLFEASPRSRINSVLCLKSTRRLRCLHSQTHSRIPALLRMYPHVSKPRFHNEC
ncbi:unnamed protein product [Ectocarpus sp. 12 AP-2014]